LVGDSLLIIIILMVLHPLSHHITIINHIKPSFIFTRTRETNQNDRKPIHWPTHLIFFDVKLSECADRFFVFAQREKERDIIFLSISIHTRENVRQDAIMSIAVMV